MIRDILLDLDDTILDFHAAEAVAIRKTLSSLGVEPTEEVVSLYSRINAGQWERLERGEATRDEVKEVRFAILFSELGASASPGEAKVLYEYNLSIGHYFIPGAEELLKTLSEKYTLYLASNGTLFTQRSRIESAGIARYFRKIFLSEMVGAVKPQRAFFDACFAKMPGAIPETTVILGDSLSSDIQGGIHAGIRTCWFNPHNKPLTKGLLPDAEIHALAEFPAVLERM